MFAALNTSANVRVICFEPDPINFERLIWACNRNSARAIIALPLALSSKKGEMSLFRSPSGDGGLSSLVPLDGFEIAGEVPVASLDDILSCINHSEISVIKVDVEGHEEDVLRGAERAISSHLPTVILELVSERGLNAAKFLIQKDFLLFVTEGKGAPSIEHLTRIEPRILRADNAVLIHKDKISTVSKSGLRILT